MIHSLNSVRKYEIQAADGSIGKIKDVLFDSQEWRVRYLVADTRKWLPGRKVLIPTKKLSEPDHDAEKFPVTMTRDEVKESPGIDEDAPVSRLIEQDVHAYYGLPYYWLAPAGTGQGPAPVPVRRAPNAAPGLQQAEQTAVEKAETEIFLRSLDEVTGYRLHAEDGEFGAVEDLLADSETWDVRYLVVDTRKFLPSKDVLVPPAWCERVDYGANGIKLSESKETIQSAPPFNPARPIDREYEQELYAHFQRPVYWGAV